MHFGGFYLSFTVISEAYQTPQKKTVYLEHAAFKKIKKNRNWNQKTLQNHQSAVYVDVKIFCYRL